MTKKLAIDWDDTELRIVSANCSGSNVTVTDAALIPIKDGDVTTTLREAIKQRRLENTEALVAIGRGKAELRELQLPPVPEDELPDMVRFQAIRSFASAGDSATVDYLITKRSSESISMLAAAVGPVQLNEIEKTCQAASLTTKRVALRPLAAAALYLGKQKSISGETVLIDLLASDAEIVVARNGKVIFVRTVRMPTTPEARSKALAGELRRSLMACDSDGSPEKVVLWGRESVHRGDIEQLSEAIGGNVEVVDPFSLVNVDAGVTDKLPDHIGRLAPLVGLLSSDESGSDRLIDFLNPRKRVIEEPNPFVRILMIAAPVAAVLLLGFFAYRNLSDLDQKIATLSKANGNMKADVDRAEESLSRTDIVDQFLDGNVNWLDEIRSLAGKMPDSDELIVKSIVATANTRSALVRGPASGTIGGGTLHVTGAVTEKEVIDRFEYALRDENHTVVGGATKPEKGSYPWSLDESITVGGEFVRNQRYAGLSPVLAEIKDAAAVIPETEVEPEATGEPAAEVPPDSATDEPGAKEEPAKDQPTTNDSEADVEVQS